MFYYFLFLFLKVKVTKFVPKHFFFQITGGKFNSYVWVWIFELS